MKSLYIAATSQHVGKTTNTLGMLAALQKRNIKVGYSKPLGQQFHTVKGKRVDKDAVLFSETLKTFDLIPDIHSPVILGPGDTAELLDDPKTGVLERKILHAAETLNEDYDFVLYEGTGHPGVGSVVGLSNARVAELLETQVVLVLEGGIGNTIDRLALCKALFDAHGVSIVGVILNKVLPQKMDKIRQYVEPWIEANGMQLLGLMPYDSQLVYPSIKHVVKVVKGEVISGAKETMNTLVHEALAGGTSSPSGEHPPENLLLVVSRGRFLESLHHQQKLAREQGRKFKLAGVMLTSKGHVSSKALKICEEQGIPVITTDFDTYQAVVKMSHLVAKIDTKSPAKVQRAIDLFEENIDMDKLLKLVE
jgi:BioD-like phosphotransacetylase family protein